MKIGSLNQKVSSGFVITIFLLLIGALVILVLGGEQQRNLAKARAHGKMLQPILNQDPRFGIRLGAYTGGNGMLWINGWVETKEDLRALRQVVDNSNPPVACRWSVRVMEDELNAIEEDPDG